MTDEGKKNTPPPQALSQELSAFGGPVSRLPMFYKSSPALWFVQAEAVFFTSRVTSPQIKFQAVLSVLELEVLTQVADILTDSSDDPYSTLKARLISIYGESESRRIHRLLENTQLGDQRPSQLYRQMTQLAGTTLSKDMVTTLWLRNLPLRVQEILTATKQDDTDALIDVADRIMEIERPAEAYATSRTSEPNSSELHELREEMRRLRAELADLRIETRSRSRDRGRTARSPNRSASKGRTLCYFHRRFRQKARKCVQPCDWKPKAPTTN